MMGVHVANFGSDKVYFNVDPNTPQETGALVYASGGASFFNFWGWVSANPEITRLEDNEFQEFLWNEPLPQDEELWESSFFSRTVPLSGIIDPKLLVNVGGSKAKPGNQESKENIARQIMERGATNEQR